MVQISGTITVLTTATNPAHSPTEISLNMALAVAQICGFVMLLSCVNLCLQFTPFAFRCLCAQVIHYITTTDAIVVPSPLRLFRQSAGTLWQLLMEMSACCHSNVDRVFCNAEMTDFLPAWKCVWCFKMNAVLNDRWWIKRKTGDVNFVSAVLLVVCCSWEHSLWSCWGLFASFES